MIAILNIKAYLAPLGGRKKLGGNVSQCHDTNVIVLMHKITKKALKLLFSLEQNYERSNNNSKMVNDGPDDRGSKLADTRSVRCIFRDWTQQNQLTNSTEEGCIVFMNVW